MISVRRFAAISAPRLAPAMPPPTMMTSNSVISRPSVTNWKAAPSRGVAMFNGAFTELLLVALAAILMVAAVIDVRTFTISNRLNATVALLAPALLVVDCAGAVAGHGGAARRGRARIHFAGRRILRGDDGRRRRQARGRAGLMVLACRHYKISRPDVARRGRAHSRHPRLAPRASAARDVPKFRTESRSHSAVSRFSPNGFLTNLSDV